MTPAALPGPDPLTALADRVGAELHEVYNSLMVIHNLAGVLTLTLPADGPAREAAAKIANACNRVTDGCRRIEADVSAACQSVPARVQPAPVGQDTLSDREALVLQLVSLGYSNKEIAPRIDVSVKTVETFKSRGMKKLGLRNRVGLIRHAVAAGWLAAASDPTIMEE